MPEPTPEQKITALEGQIKNLTAERDAAKKEADTHKAASQQAQKENQQALTIVTELKQKLADKDAGTVKLPTVTVGKETYELLTNFTWKGQEVTLEVLNENAKLAQELVKEGVANLRKLSPTA